MALSTAGTLCACSSPFRYILPVIPLPLLPPWLHYMSTGRLPRWHCEADASVPLVVCQDRMWYATSASFFALHMCTTSLDDNHAATSVQVHGFSALWHDTLKTLPVMELPACPITGSKVVLSCKATMTRSCMQHRICMLILCAVADLLCGLTLHISDDEWHEIHVPGLAGEAHGNRTRTRRSTLRSGYLLGEQRDVAQIEAKGEPMHTCP
jgi:hypothetical protein